MLVQRLEDLDLRGIEKRFDLLVRAFDNGLNLLMFLIFGQACILEDRRDLLILGNQNGLDFALLGSTEGQFSRQEGELLIRAHMMMTMMPFASGWLVGARC